MKAKSNAEKLHNKEKTKEDALKLLREGQNISAIKLYMSRHNLGLKDSKDEVEKLIDELFKKEKGS